MNSIRMEFKECIKNNDAKELKSFLIEKKVTQDEFNYLLDNLTWQKFNFVISLLAHENILDKYFEKEQLYDLLNTYQDYIIYNNTRTKYKLVEFYPKNVLLLVESWGEKKIIKTFQHSEFFAEIIYILIENMNYLKFLKHSYIAYKDNNINSSKVLLIVCKYISTHLDIFDEEIAANLNEYAQSEIHIDFTFSEWVNFFKFYKNVELKFYDFATIINFYRTDKDIAMFISDPNDSEHSKDIEEKIVNYIKVEGFGLMLEILPEKYLNGELMKVLNDAKTIINTSGKLNLAESNNNFNYTLVTKIYPVLGIKETLNLLKYRTHGYEKVLNLFEDGKESEVVEVLNLEKKLNIFGGAPETIHFLFENIESWELLRQSLLKSNISLSKEDIIHLKNIILSSNFLGIENVEQLTDKKTGYNEILYKNYEMLCIKDMDSQLFGFDSGQKLLQVYTGYNLNDLNKLKKIYQLANFPKHLLLTKEEYEVIKILRSRYKCSKDTYLDNLKDRYNKGKSLDMSEDLRKIISKISKTYEIVFNQEFSRIPDLSSLSETIDGVRMLHLTNEPFKFLIHTLKGYSSDCRSYVELLKENPSLWDKLDGSTTISTCYIQDNVFKFVGKYEVVDLKEPVICYLFNNIPEEHLMFMDKTDVFVTEGKNILSPEVSHSAFYDLDVLSYHTRVSQSYTYNEVVMKRENINPCAIATFKNYPTPEEIKAAKHFNVPIINFSDYNKSRNTTKNKELFMKSPTKELAREIIYKSDNLSGNIKWIIKTIQNLRNNNKMTHEDYLKILYYLYQESKVTNKTDLEEFIKKLICTYNLLNEGIKDFKIKLNFEKDGLIIINDRKKYVFPFNIDNPEKKVAINKIKSTLKINYLDDYLSFKVKNKNYWLTSYIDEDMYISLNWQIFGQQSYYEYFMKEYVLHLLFGQVFYHTTEKDFKCNVRNKKIFSIFDLDPASIINITKEDYPEDLKEVSYYLDDVLGALITRINKGVLNNKVQVMIDFAEKIENIPEEEFIEIFKYYFNVVEKNEGVSSDYLMDLLLEQKRNIKSIIIGMLEPVLNSKETLNKRIRNI